MTNAPTTARAELVDALNLHHAIGAELSQAKQSDETWDSWVDAGAAIHDRVAALPDTPENLGVRALAIGGIASNPGDPTSQVIGTGNASAYMEGLATLRTLVDQTDRVAGAQSASRARFDLMDNRLVIVAEARRRIYGHT